MRRTAAALLIAASAGAHAQADQPRADLDAAHPVLGPAIPDADVRLPGPLRAPELKVEQRIDPWSRWRVRLYVDGAPGNMPSRAGMDARWLTQRVAAHEIQVGACASVSPAPLGAVLAWQAVDDCRSSLFIEDRWRWSPELVLSMGARVAETPDAAALQRRVALTWQPAPAWTFRAIQGDAEPASPAFERPTRFRGVEMRTQQRAGPLQVQARAASQQSGDPQQPAPVLHAAAFTMTLPLGWGWAIGNETRIAAQGSATRLKVSGALLGDRARVTLVVPHRFDAGTTDPAFGASPFFVDGIEPPGLRAHVELRF